MKVRQAMNPHIATILSQESLTHAASFFVNEELNGVVVLGPDSAPCGLVAKSSIIKAVSHGADLHQPVSRYMGTDFAVIEAEQALESIDFNQSRHFLVQEGDTIIGVLTQPLMERICTRSVHGLFVEINYFIDHLQNPLILLDTQGRIVLCNAAATRMLGCEKSDAVHSLISDLVPQFGCLEQQSSRVTAQRFLFNGTAYLMSWTRLNTGTDDLGLLGFFHDLSEMEAVSEELNKAQLLSLQLDAIIESSFDGIFVTDGESTVLRINQAYERITGIKAREVLGKTMDTLVADGFYDESVSLRVIESRRPITIVQHVMKTGKTIVVTGNPVFDEHGEIRLVVTNVRDVTELNSLQEKLRRMESLTSRYAAELREIKVDEELEHKFILASKAMQELKQLAQRLSQVDSTLLIQGESGVGKGVFAQMVHAYSDRRGKPFLQISCAAIPEQLLESELFGYSEGAFTGAKKTGKPGMFEMAHGGCIFLDEIGEMPIGLQVKLLRVLQEKEVSRIGDASTSIKVDVRIMAATNRNLEAMVEKKEFRKDLYYRLNVVPVSIPPVRERKDGLVHKIYTFLERCNTKNGWSKQIDKDVLEAMTAYEWPGNVRELENMIERMAVMSRGEVITFDDLPSQLQSQDMNLKSIEMQGRTLQSIVQDVEKKALQQAMKTQGSTRKAARVLGISQSSVVRKSRLYGLKIQES